MVDAADDFEARILRFEQARRAGDFGPIAPWLAGCAGSARRRLLVELICLDLEFHWRGWPAREPIPLAGYVAALPEIGALDQIPIEIVVEAYQARRRWGDRPAPAEFLAGFTTHRDRIALARELTRADAELAAEATEPDQARAPTLAFEPVPAADLLSDRDFRLHRMVGAGRMGKVYAATRLVAGEPVAVKYLRRGLLAHPGVVRRFLDEAATVARLRHPGIVGTSGLGRTGGGSWFIVMDWVDGPNLAEVARSRSITLAEVVRWGSELCAALDHAHEQGVIHCDLKPANLLLDRAGRVRITDFGLARSLTAATPGSAEVEGTAPFLAPEQVAPVWGPIDARTDVYGVGAVLFTLLAGRPPLVGHHLPDLLAAALSPTPIISLADLRPDLPAAICDLCQLCLAKRPADRVPSARALGLALGAIQPGEDGANPGG